MYIEVTLIGGKTTTYDDDRNVIESEDKTTVYATRQSVTRQEWFTAGQNGHRADFRLIVHKAEYGNQKAVEIDNVRYAIYRTFENGSEIELYCEEQGGVTNG